MRTKDSYCCIKKSMKKKVVEGNNKDIADIDRNAFIIQNNSSDRFFFIPWVGKNYEEGINGKKVLVLGASFYCNQDGRRKELCPFYDDCTVNQNTRKYDMCCPFNHGKPLHDLPSEDLCKEAQAHNNFFNLFKEFLCTDNLNFDDFWENAAFTNYVQHEIGYRTKTLSFDCRNEYLAQFEDVLMSLPQIPDVVIIWGCVVDKPIKNKKESERFPKFVNTFTVNDSYSFQWKNYDGKDIVFLNLYHPSLNRWFCNTKEWTKMLGLLKDIFNE